MKLSKKLLGVLLMASIAVATFEGCKKGENDPALSIRTRKGKLSKEWRLTKKDVTETETIGATQTTTVTSYNGSIETESTTGTGIPTPIVDDKVYSMTITFEKSGTYKMEEIEDNVLTTTEGNWVFSGKNKDSDLKKKEAVYLNITSRTTVGSSSTYTDADIDVSFLIDRLHNKELVILIDEAVTGTSYSSTTKGTWTFEKK